MTKHLKFAALLLVLLPALFLSSVAPTAAHAQAQGGTIVTLENPFNYWTGINVYNVGSLQFATTPRPCPTNEFSIGLDATLAPVCAPVSGPGTATGPEIYPVQCQSGNAPTWCGASGQTADVYIRAACGQLPSTGGVINLLGLTGTIAASVPCSTPTKQVLIIQDTTSLLTITETDGLITFPLDNYSGLIGPGNGTGQCIFGAGIAMGNGANITAITGPVRTDGSQEAFTASGLCLFGLFGTVTQGLINANSQFANTTISNNNIGICNNACIKLLNTSAEVYNNWLNAGDGGHTIVASPLIIESTGSAGCHAGLIHVRGNQIEHAVGGGPEIAVITDGGGALNCGIMLEDLGIERNTGGIASAVGIQLEDCWQCKVDGITYTGTGTGNDAIQISQSATGRTQNVTISNILAGPTAYTNILNDTTVGGSVIPSISSPQLTLYYSNPAYLQPANLPPTTIQSVDADLMGGLGSFSTGSSTLGTDFGPVGCTGLTTCTFTRTNSTAPPGFTYSQEIAISANGGSLNGISYTPPVPVAAGKQYIASFYAKSDGTFTGAPTFVLGNEAAPPIYCYSVSSQPITTAWQLYSFNCTPTSTVSTVLNIGATGNELGTFWIGGFTFEPLSPMTPGKFMGAVSPYGASTSVNGVSISVGAGAPTSACGTSPTGNGSLYLRTDGGTGTSLYKCESGTWVAE